MTIDAELIRTAARILNITEAEAQSNSKEIADHAVTQVWNPGRGGAAVIIGPDRSYLRYAGMTGPLEALERYLAGERTPG